MFHALVLGPQNLGAMYSTLKAEMVARLDLWNGGGLDELACKAKILNKPPYGRSKTQREARRPARLLHKSQIARTSQLAIWEANEDTIRAIPPLFLAQGELLEAYLLTYHGPLVAPLQDPPLSTITPVMLRECLTAAPPLSTPHHGRVEK